MELNCPYGEILKWKWMVLPPPLFSSFIVGGVTVSNAELATRL